MMHIRLYAIFISLIGVISQSGCRTRNRDNIEPMLPASAIVVHASPVKAASRIKKVEAFSEKVGMLDEDSYNNSSRCINANNEQVDRSVPIEFLKRCGIFTKNYDSKINTEEKIVLDNLGTFLKMIEKDGIKEEDVIPIFQLAYAEGIQLDSISSLFHIALDQGVPSVFLTAAFNIGLSNGISIPEIVDFFSLARVEKVLIADVIELFNLSLEDKIPPCVMVATYRLGITHGIPVDVIKGLAEISYNTGFSPKDVVESYTALNKQNILPSIAIAMIPMVKASNISEIDEAIECLSEDSGLPIAVIRIEAMKAILAIFGVSSKSFKLNPIGELFASRWEVVSPPDFSELWDIKNKAIELEESGQNTDALWKEFWDKFIKSSDYE